MPGRPREGEEAGRGDRVSKRQRGRQARMEWVSLGETGPGASWPL